MSNKLKPCPFCGCKPIQQNIEDAEAGGGLKQYVECINESCTNSDSWYELNEWQNQPYISTLQSEIDRLNQQLQKTQQLNAELVEALYILLEAIPASEYATPKLNSARNKTVSLLNKTRAQEGEK